MKCTKCGKEISIIALKCPECHNQTFLGWFITGKISKKEELYNQTHNNSFLSPYAWNRVLNRVLTFLLVIFVALVLTGSLNGQIKHYFKSKNHAEVVKELDEFYKDEDFVQMYLYMREQDIFWDDEYENYRHMADLGNNYNDYTNYKLQFLSLEDLDKPSHVFYLNSALYYACRVYNYDDDYVRLTSRNQKVLNKYQKEIESFLKGICVFTDDEIEDLLASGKSPTEEVTKLYANKALERKGWQDVD